MQSVGFHPEARKELEETALYYESCQKGLGVAFLDSFESGFRQVVRAPNVWRRIGDRLHRFLLKRFPHAILYGWDQDYVYVVAVVHLKREPDYWLDRLDGLPPFDA